MYTNVTTLLHPHDIQILVCVGLAEDREQILDHHVYTHWTICLAGLYARVMQMKFAGTVVDDAVPGEIRDLETKLRYQFNRKLARLLALTLNDGYVVLLTETIPATFDCDWSNQSHRCEPGKNRICQYETVHM